MLMGEARVLLTTWEVTRDQANVTRLLARLDKLYGPGSEATVRSLMHKVKREERPE